MQFFFSRHILRVWLEFARAVNVKGVYATWEQINALDAPVEAFGHVAGYCEWFSTRHSDVVHSIESYASWEPL